jgi:predicted porin
MAETKGTRVSGRGGFVLAARPVAARQASGRRSPADPFLATDRAVIEKKIDEAGVDEMTPPRPRDRGGAALAHRDEERIKETRIMKARHVAVASLTIGASPAFAEPGITLYGIVDVNIEYVDKMSSTAPGSRHFPGRAARRVAMNSGGLAGSRWGVRVEERLGGGNKALVVLESGFGANNGRLHQGGRLFGRQAFVGLDTHVGKLTFGRQYTSLFDALAAFSPTAYAAQYEPSIFMAGRHYRSDNTATVSRTFGKVSARAHWSFDTGVSGAGDASKPDGRDRGYGMALSYADGSFAFTAAYDEIRPSMAAFGDAGFGNAKKAAVATSYRVGKLKAMGGYRWGHGRFSDGATFIRDDYWWLGLNYQPVVGLRLTLAYYYDDLKTLRPTPRASSGSPANPAQVSFIADYDLSKRTDLYFAVAHAKHAALNFDGPTIAFAGAYPAGTNQSGMFGAAAGIRHRF